MEQGASRFSDEELKKITSIEGKTLEQVICYIWVNKTDPNAIVELIDNVELRFADHTHLVISCNQDVEGLTVSDDFDYRQEQVQLDQEFGGKIRIIPVDASKTKMWEDVPGKVLESVDVTREGNDYLSDSIVLNFEKEKRIISLSPLDGLIIDYYED